VPQNLYHIAIVRLGDPELPFDSACESNYTQQCPPDVVVVVVHEHNQEFGFSLNSESRVETQLCTTGVRIGANKMSVMAMSTGFGTDGSNRRTYAGLLELLINASGHGMVSDGGIVPLIW
jgi:hypothetical protein